MLLSQRKAPQLCKNCIIYTRFDLFIPVCIIVMQNKGFTNLCVCKPVQNYPVQIQPDQIQQICNQRSSNAVHFHQINPCLIFLQLSAHRLQENEMPTYHFILLRNRCVLSDALFFLSVGGFFNGFAFGVVHPDEQFVSRLCQQLLSV